MPKQRFDAWSKETDRWLLLLSKTKRHANAEEGAMALASGGAALGLYELLPLTTFLLFSVPLALGAALTIGALVKALKRSLRRRRYRLSRERRQLTDSLGDRPMLRNPHG